MRERERFIVTIGRRARRAHVARRAARTVAMSLLLALVAGAVGGCVVVPLGGYGYHEHHGGYRHHYWD